MDKKVYAVLVFLYEGDSYDSYPIHDLHSLHSTKDGAVKASVELSLKRGKNEKIIFSSRAKHENRAGDYYSDAQICVEEIEVEE